MASWTELAIYNWNSFPSQTWDGAIVTWVINERASHQVNSSVNSIFELSGIEVLEKAQIVISRFVANHTLQSGSVIGADLAHEVFFSEEIADTMEMTASTSPTQGHVENVLEGLTLFDNASTVASFFVSTQEQGSFSESLQDNLSASENIQVTAQSSLSIIPFTQITYSLLQNSTITDSLVNNITAEENVIADGMVDIAATTGALNRLEVQQAASLSSIILNNISAAEELTQDHQGAVALSENTRYNLSMGESVVGDMSIANELQIYPSVIEESILQQTLFTKAINSLSVSDGGLLADTLSISASFNNFVNEFSLINSFVPEILTNYNLNLSESSTGMSSFVTLSWGKPATLTKSTWTPEAPLRNLP